MNRMEREFLLSSLVVMDLKEVMAINLCRIRHAKEMTQEELADRAGLSVRYVGAIEGRRVGQRDGAGPDREGVGRRSNRPD